MSLDAIVLLALILGAPVAAAGIVAFALAGRIQKKWLVRSSAAVLALYGLALLYGYFIEPHWVEATRT
jgi:hypothetical protein